LLAIERIKKERIEREDASMPEVVVKGTKIHYLKENSRISNPDLRILFIHGGGGNASLWHKVMEELAKEYEPLAISLPGHGESWGEGMNSISAYREFLKDFFDALGLEKVILAGNMLMLEAPHGLSKVIHNFIRSLPNP